GPPRWIGSSASASPVHSPAWKKANLNFPIWISSPEASFVDSTRSRFTYVPFRLPRSWIQNSDPCRRISACRLDTVTSSRKTSLSGFRPAVVDSFSIRNVEPALGPRLTTRRACPGSRPASWTEISSEASSSISTGVMPRVVSSCSGAPQFAQNRASSLLGCPQRVQNTVRRPLLPTSRSAWRLKTDLNSRPKLDVGPTSLEGSTEDGSIYLVEPGCACTPRPQERHHPDLRGRGGGQCFSACSTKARYAAASMSASSSEGSVISMTASQPSPYGWSLTSSGLSSSSAFRSTSVPVTGLNTSETDFVESTSLKGWDAVTRVPTSGTATYTTSPRASWA